MFGRVFFAVVRHIAVVTFFSVKFYQPSMYRMPSMQSLLLEFFWKFKVFTEIDINETNYQT